LNSIDTTGGNIPMSCNDDEWRKRLTPRQYAILRKNATERPWSSALNDEHRHGVYHCAGCHAELFSSETKYASHSGWPSFWQPLPGALGETRDTSHGMLRIANHCARCGGHLGHVFDDGPPPTGLRYCVNGEALMFVPAQDTGT